MDFKDFFPAGSQHEWHVIHQQIRSKRQTAATQTRYFQASELLIGTHTIPCSWATSDFDENRASIDLA